MVDFFKETEPLEKRDYIEIAMFIFLGLFFMTVYDLRVGAILGGMSILVGFLMVLDKIKIVNVPGGESLKDNIYTLILAVFFGIGLQYIFGFASNIGSAAIPFDIGTSLLVAAGGLTLGGSLFITRIFSFVSTVIAFPRVEEHLWQTFQFWIRDSPMFSGYLGRTFGLMLVTSFAFGAFHLITAATLLAAFGVPVGPNLLNVIVLRMAATLIAFSMGLEHSKWFHMGFNFPAWLIMAGIV